ncbi:MAG: hypothetical protein KF718_06710 [Polyangiaceae bacterium]|nr:hypothetical protein [Polyangiaceae bacterium]
MKSRQLSGCVAALAVALGSWACGEDEPLGGGASGGSGGSGASGGSGGSGGSSASGGSGGAGGSEAGLGGSSGSGGSDGGLAPGLLLTAATDFFSTTELAVVDLATNTVTQRVDVTDGDAVPRASRGRGFLLARSSSEVVVVGKTTATPVIDVGHAAIGTTGTGSTNPSDVVASGDDAFVFLYDVNRIAVASLTTGQIASTIVLDDLLDTGDGDGAIELGNATYDPKSDRFYFIAGRIDRTTIAPPNYELACSAAPALLLALDPTSKTLVDLNGSAPGTGVDLSLKNPVDMVLDPVNDRLLVLSAGCFAASEAGTARSAYGVTAVSLSGLSEDPLLLPTSGDYLARLLLLGSGQAIINGFDANFAEYWHLWTTTSSSLGASLAAVPTGATFEAGTSLLGLSFQTLEGGTSVEVVRYDTATQNHSTVLSDPFLGSLGFAAGSVVVQP